MGIGTELWLNGLVARRMITSSETAFCHSGQPQLHLAHHSAAARALWKGSNQPEKLSTIDSNLMKLNHTCPPPTLPDTSAMSTAAQGVLQITRWHYCMEHRVNRSTIFDFDPFYIFSPGKTITLLIPFLHDGGLFPWRYNPSLGWKNRTGLHRAPTSALSNTPTDGWTKAPDLINRLHGGESSMKKKASQSPIPSPSINKSIKYFIDPWWSHSRQARTASH